jgi:hypothetical protein
MATKKAIAKNVKKKIIQSTKPDVVDIPSVTAFQPVAEPVENVEIAADVEQILLKNGYIPLNTIRVQNDKKDLISTYIKAVNSLGQKVYILLDKDDTSVLDADLTMVEIKNGALLPYSLKSGAIKMAGMDSAGVAFECDKGGLCVLSNVMEEQNENLSVVESNFTFLESKCNDNTIIENFGCHLSYPVITMAEIRVNNCLVLQSTSNITHKLKNAAFHAHAQELQCFTDSVANLQTVYATFNGIVQNNVIKLNETLTTLEEYNAYYTKNPPCNECDVKKYKLIKHNLRLVNDSITYLLCGMKSIAENRNKIETIICDMNDFSTFFEEQLASLDCADNNLV